MGNNKNNKNKNKNNNKNKNKKMSVYRTKEERQTEVRPIIEKLSELKLNTEYPEIVTLFKHIGKYIQEGERIELNIPFPAIGRRISGVLATNTCEQVWVKMEKEKF